MKKQLIYEAKRILLPLIIFTAIACVLYILTALNTDFIITRYHMWSDPAGLQSDELVPYEAAGNPLTNFVCTILLDLCFVVPVMQYSYRMKKRSVDLWYSLPITRTRLMLVRTLGGLALVLIPYTLSYWLGFAVIACSENVFELSQYVPLFFASIGVGVLLYFVNSFLFTRANTVRDGILFLLIWNLAPVLPFLTIGARLSVSGILSKSYLFFPLTPTFSVFGYFSALIRGDSSSIPYAWFLFTLAGLEGAAACFGLFYTAKRHRAEDAGQLSSSAFGYKVLIPFCVLLTVAIFPVEGTQSFYYLYYAMILIGGLISYFIYRRSFRLKKEDLFSLFGSFVGGILLSLLFEVF